MSTTTLEQLREEQNKLTQQIADAEREFVEGLPADAIRQREAEDKYGLTPVRLSTWVHRDQVRQYAVLSHKMRFVSENDIRKRLGLEPLSTEN